MTGENQRFYIPNGEDLRQLRLKKGYTQSQLAELSGVSQALIARIEKESINPRLSTVRTILAVLYGDEKCLSYRS